MLTEKEWREKVDAAFERFSKHDNREAYQQYIAILGEKPEDATIGIKEDIIYAQHKSLLHIIEERNQLYKENTVLKQLLNVIEIQQIDLELKPDDATIN